MGSWQAGDRMIVGLRKADVLSTDHGRYWKVTENAKEAISIIKDLG